MLSAAIYLSVALNVVSFNASSIDVTLAQRYFSEARWLSDDDAGELWGVPLYGPMIFVNRSDRSAIANQKPAISGFVERDGVWLGQWPSDRTIANTAVGIGDERWTMVMWPLPKRRTERAKLMAHELFHRIQPELGIPLGSPRNEHLEQLNGRLWLRLEVAALGEALLLPASKRMPHIKNALLFRAFRQSLFEGSKETEDLLELNEGLAEYTGILHKGTWEPEARMWQGQQLKQIAQRQLSSYSRSFAYWTGSAYGLLLNVEDVARDGKPTWRLRLSPKSSLADELARAVKWNEPVSEESATAAAKAYGYDSILAEETEKERGVQERAQEYRKQFFEDPVLVLPLIKMNFSFNPNDVFALGDEGNVYGTATIIDEWGTLTVTDGVFISSDFKSIRVTAPTTALESKGAGWSLSLNDEWHIKSSAHSGDFVVIKTE